MTDRPNIQFGTDGWRAIIAEDFTFANVRACAEAVARNLIATNRADQGLVVGFDTRYGSPRFAQAVAEVVNGHGIYTHMFDVAAPTPACSFAVVDHSAANGVMITASHNSPEWNGFKVKSSDGGSATPAEIAQIEERLAEVLDGKTTDIAGKQATNTVFDVITPYIEQLHRVIDIAPIKAKPLKVVVDAMHGSGAGILPQMLADGAIEVTEIRSENNPNFPGMDQPEPIEHNLKPLSVAVIELGADVGIALDGDADRVGIVDENGRYLTTLEVFSILTDHFMGRRNERSGVACTITMSSMVDKLSAHYGAPVYRTPIGFKFVGPTMIDNSCSMGGEESGGYAFKGHVPERDGSLSGLLFLEAMVMSGKKSSELLTDLHALVGPHTFRRIDVSYEESQRTNLAKKVSSAAPATLGGLALESYDRRDGVRFNLAGGSWGVVRMSGTEPLVRIYAETPDDKTLEAVLTDLRSIMGV
ncbi:MAG: phosphoglucomutase/phosphomannomutase family protein [Dehalococcoidia bacterium]|nr:phosphoglucomutase/phosphomannomutase family protein [Dehalococcoidia bacterium]